MDEKEMEDIEIDEEKDWSNSKTIGILAITFFFLAYFALLAIVYISEPPRTGIVEQIFCSYYEIEAFIFTLLLMSMIVTAIIEVYED